MQRVNKEIFKVLESTLPHKTGIYPDFGGEDARFPFVVYSCDSFAPERSKMKIELYRMQYSFDIFSDKFDVSDQISDQIIKGLEGYRSEVIAIAHFQSGSSAYDGSFRHTLNFEIIANEC